MKPKTAVLASAGVLVFSLAGWVALGGSGYRVIPTQRLTAAPALRSSPGPLFLMGVAKLEQETDSLLEVSHDRSYPQWVRHEDVCHVMPSGEFAGKHACGNLEYVSMLYPGQNGRGCKPEYWPLRPFKLNGDPLNEAETQRVNEALRAVREIRNFDWFEEGPSGLFSMLGNEERLNAPMVVAMLRWDEKNPRWVNRIDFDVSSLDTGWASRHAGAWSAGNYLFGRAEFMLWHDAAMRLEFGIRHEMDCTLEFPLTKGGSHVEGRVGVTVLSWLTGAASLREIDDEKPGTAPRPNLYRLEKVPFTTADTTTVLTLSNVLIQAEEGLEVSALSAAGQWTPAEVQSLRLFLALKIPLPAEQIQRLRFHWKEMGGTRVIADVPRMPGVPEENRGVRDFSRIRIPIDAASLELDEADILIGEFFQLRPDEGPRYPLRHPVYYSFGGGSIPVSPPASAPYRGATGDRTIRPAPNDPMTGAALLHRWNRLSGGAGVKIMDNGHGILLGPSDPWRERWEALKGRLGL